MNHFRPYEHVGLGNETQLQMGKNVNNIKGLRIL